jgi:TonB family protein
MSPRWILLAPLIAGTAAPAPAQRSPTPAIGQRCVTVPDSVPGPTAGQIAERQELRSRLVEVARRNGVTQPKGLLLVEVDSSRKGQVLFMESNYPPAAVEQATAAVGEYLESLPGGRGYQALVRVDGEYPVMRGGRQHCPPVLYTSNDERLRLINDAEERHPRAGQLTEDLDVQALVLLVVTRDGTVALAATARSTGDAFLDQAALEIGRQLRFAPATLDGEPFDTRIRLPIAFSVH